MLMSFEIQSDCRSDFGGVTVLGSQLGQSPAYVVIYNARG